MTIWIFFLRFDKDEYIRNDKLMLTDSGNCFHIKIIVKGTKI